MRLRYHCRSSTQLLVVKKFIPLALCVLLSACHTPPVQKQGVVIGFKKVNRDDPELIKSDRGERRIAADTSESPSNSTPASPVASGAVAGGIAGAATFTATNIGTIAAGTVAAPALAFGAAAIGIGAATGALISAIRPDTDCGDGWALFTLKTAEGETKTIRQPRIKVCKYTAGEVVRYMEHENGVISVFPKTN